jgi:TM2 domain-containing membrane protein YozV
MPQENSRRRATMALILSGLFPGLGQLYNRQPVQGAAFLIAGIVLSWLVGRAVPMDLSTLAAPGPAVIVPLVLLLIVWLWSVIAAWTGARRLGR